MTKPETGVQPSVSDTDDNEDPGVTLDELKACVDNFLEATIDARSLSERCRDYKDGKQWTEAQIKELKRRKQAAIVNNRIKTKHQGLLGLAAMRKADPKAYPRNVDADDGAADACTDGLRYAADKTNLNATMLMSADNFFCEGYCGVHITTEQSPATASAPQGNIDVLVDHIPWDRIFFDPYSRRSDFSDSRDKGYMMWMDEETIEEMFPDAPEDTFEGATINTDTTFEDRPAWFRKDGNYKRYLVAVHYYKYKGQWWVAVYTGSAYLMKPTVSPFLDEYGQPECPIELEHAYIDRENNRYGELAAFLDLQDEINHRRSKALFLLSQRQTFGNRGAVKDVKAAKRELAKPDGHLEVGNGEFGKDFGILPTGDMAQGQFELLQEAKSEIDSQSYNAQLSGQRQQGDLSGVAIGKLQQSGVIELNMLFDNFTSFRLRIYRQMWNRIRQYWTDEKWVRVTDDQKSLRWVGFNVQMTMKDSLQEIMDDESKPQAMRLGASAQMIQLEQANPQALDQIITVKNRPAELDMDIILDESMDVINASQEQLDAILKFGAQQQFDILDLLEISNITGKDKLIDKIEKRRDDAQKAQAEAAQDNPQMALIAAKVQETSASAEGKKQDALQTAIENDLLQVNQEIAFKGSVSA